MFTSIRTTRRNFPFAGTFFLCYIHDNFLLLLLMLSNSPVLFRAGGERERESGGEGGGGVFWQVMSGHLGCGVGMRVQVPRIVELERIEHGGFMQTLV